MPVEPNASPHRSVLSGAGWTVVVPVKSTGRGKSRIDLPPAARAAVSLALATDTLTAATSAGVEVVVITDDATDAVVLGAIDGVRVHLTAVDGLNPAIADGIAGLTGPVAVLLGDLPDLSGAELRGALAAAENLVGMGVVADRQGVGTTLLAAVAGAGALRPEFGGASFAAHLARRARPLPVPIGSGLRRDVDTLDDLLAVRAPATRAALARIEARAGAPDVCPVAAQPPEAGRRGV